MTEQLFEPEPTAATVGFAYVALERGIDAGSTGLTYAIPEALDDLTVGSRVVVPLGRGNRPVSGYVVALADEVDLDPARIKLIVSRDPHDIRLTPDLIELARWMAGYYCCPLGMVFATMLPAAVKRGIGTVRQTMVSLPEPGAAPEGGEADADKVKVTKLQQAVLDAAVRLAAQGEDWVEIKHLADVAGARSVSPVNQLIRKQLLVTRMSTAVVARAGAADEDADPPSPPLQLNSAQREAFDRLAASVGDGFSVHLLKGVTGSGKTEVYLRVIEHLFAVHPERGAIMLIPEIALTPQTVGRFRARFDDVAVLHSGQSAAVRHEHWRRIRQGQARIVVGARSAVFAPLPQLGIIIVDEEHEYSYKQDQLPRYHGRDVAVKRGQLAGVPVVLGSATPSLESYYNATVKGSYNLLTLPQRVADLKLPTVRIVDLRDERRKRYEYTGKGGIHLLSVQLETALRRTLEDGGQAILLLNRRGFANYIACPDRRCGWLMNCEHCDATMVYHKDAKLPTGGNVRCHHCQAEQLLPQHCLVCGRNVSVFGLGTQRVEEELARKFPQTQFLRMDSDVMRTGRDYHHSLELFRSGRVQVLMGTQMIAKGLDFPNVRLVGVISADTSLQMPDFRAEERTFGLIAQVAGRAGRSEKPGLVIVQSMNPENPAIQFAGAHDYDGFAQRELALRQQVDLPPAARMARIVVRDRDFAACHEQAQKLAGYLKHFNEQQGSPVRVRTPVPCPIARIAGYHRQQIVLIAPPLRGGDGTDQDAPSGGAAALQVLLTALRNARLLISDAATAVDVDPLELL